MNWKRIWTGTLLAGLVLIAIDFVVNGWILGTLWASLQAAGQTQYPKPYTFPIIFLQDFLIGFVLTWLYALARPRLGPGPKTAIVLGGIAWCLFSVPACVMSLLWSVLPVKIAWVLLLGGLAQCWIGCYLAGWQYIEKAP